MSTVIRRCFGATPARDTHQTWLAVVDMLTRGQVGAIREELLAVAGVAASLIGEQAPLQAPIVATCDGPRTRIYCIYDEDAIEGSDANEEPLGYDPLKGDWALSLPCPSEDLAWVTAALKSHSSRITARDQSEGTSVAATEDTSAAEGLTLDLKGFLGS
jgi:hypothetical protein